jgi:hypothetical protein
MDGNLKDMSVKQLVDRFAEIGIGEAKALLYDDFDKFAELFSDMEAVGAELARRGPAAELELLSLYNHPNVQVQLKAAIYTAVEAPVAARSKVEAIASSKDFPQAGDAGMTLRSWNEYGMPKR